MDACRAILLTSALAAVLNACATNQSGEAHHLDQLPRPTQQAGDRVDPEESQVIGIPIYADEDWYQARSEAEIVWHGVLQARESDRGPAGRQALLYELVTDSGTLPVYAANAQPRLDPLLGQQVEILGKLVDLSDEGFGEELWIATVRSTEPTEPET